MQRKLFVFVHWTGKYAEPSKLWKAWIAEM